MCPLPGTGATISGQIAKPSPPLPPHGELHASAPPHSPHLCGAPGLVTGLRRPLEFTTASKHHHTGPELRPHRRPAPSVRPRPSLLARRDALYDRTTSEMRSLSPKIILGDSRRSENAQTHTYKHTVSNMKFKLKLLQIKCHVLGFTKDSLKCASKDN
jgi:hypothetical protein